MNNLLSPFNVADMLAAILVAVWTLVGLKKGLSGQIAFFIAGLAVVASLYFGFTPCQEWLVKRFLMPAQLARLVSFVALIGIPLLAVLLIHSAAGYVVKVTFTTWVDRLCGAIAGCLSACVFVALVFVLLNVLPRDIRPASFGRQSWVGRHVLGLEDKVVDVIESKLQNTRNAIDEERQKRTAEREALAP